MDWPLTLLFSAILVVNFVLFGLIVYHQGKIDALDEELRRRGRL